MKIVLLNVIISLSIPHLKRVHFLFFCPKIHFLLVLKLTVTCEIVSERVLLEIVALIKRPASSNVLIENPTTVTRIVATALIVVVVSIHLIVVLKTKIGIVRILIVLA
jgi:hypothetical protein